MKVSMELNVSDKEFYDLMMKSLKEEVKNVTKKNLELKEGLKYKDTFNKTGYRHHYCQLE